VNRILQTLFSHRSNAFKHVKVHNMYPCINSIRSNGNNVCTLGSLSLSNWGGNRFIYFVGQQSQHVSSI